MSLGRALHQKPGNAGRNAGGRGEAEPEAKRDEARTARDETGSPGREDLLGQAWRAPAFITSTARTARCGPACRVVWEGSVS